MHAAHSVMPEQGYLKLETYMPKLLSYVSCLLISPLQLFVIPFKLFRVVEASFSSPDQNFCLTQMIPALCWSVQEMKRHMVWKQTT